MRTGRTLAPEQPGLRALLVVQTDGAEPLCSAVHIYCRQTQSAGLEAAGGGSLPSPACMQIECNAPVPVPQTRRLRLLVSFAAAALPVPACLPVHCCMRDGLLLQLARCSIAPRMPPQRTSLSTADADAGRTHCGVPTLSGLPSAAAVAVAVVLGAAAECGRTLLLCCC